MECCWVWEPKSALLVLFGVGIKKLEKHFKKIEALEEMEKYIKSLYYIMAL